jgi:hypothetical protein
MEKHNTMPEVRNFLKVVKTGIPVAKTDRFKTADCFKTGLAYRDNDIDNWMTKQVPAVEGGTVTCYEMTEDSHTFMEMAHKLLSLKTPRSEETIAKSLFEQGKTFSPKQVEDLHKRFVAGETEIGFQTNNYSNLFFVHDEKGRVFVLNVYLSSDGWDVGLLKLDDSNRWEREERLFSREPKKKDTQ